MLISFQTLFVVSRSFRIFVVCLLSCLFLLCLDLDVVKLLQKKKVGLSVSLQFGGRTSPVCLVQFQKEKRHSHQTCVQSVEDLELRIRQLERRWQK